MGWMSQQSIYKRERGRFEDSHIGQIFLAEQRNDFLDH